MELNEDLPILVARAGDLFDRINQELHFQAISFCGQCSENGVQCGIPGTTMAQRDELIATRDLVKDIQSMLAFLQNLELRHQKTVESALARLDQSKIHLVERMNKYPEHGRKPEVLEELQNYLKNVKIAPNGKLREQNKDEIKLPAKEQKAHFLITCIGNIMNPRNWYNATRMAVKVIMISAPVCSGVIICRKMIEKKKSQDLKVVFADYPMKLVVMHGRG